MTFCWASAAEWTLRAIELSDGKQPDSMGFEDLTHLLEP